MAGIFISILYKTDININLKLFLSKQISEYLSWLTRQQNNCERINVSTDLIIFKQDILTCIGIVDCPASLPTHFAYPNFLQSQFAPVNLSTTGNFRKAALSSSN